MRREVERLLTYREPFYRRAADITIDTEGKGIDQVAEEVLRELGARGQP